MAQTPALLIAIALMVVAFLCYAAAAVIQRIQRIKQADRALDVMRKSVLPIDDGSHRNGPGDPTPPAA